MYKGKEALELIFASNKTHFKKKTINQEMATSGTYVAEVPLKGSAESHYTMWKHEGHLFPEAIGQHMIHGVTMHDGDWHTHGSIRSWYYTCGLSLSLYI